jgi:hypothetical protein
LIEQDAKARFALLERRHGADPLGDVEQNQKRESLSSELHGPCMNFERDITTVERLGVFEALVLSLQHHRQRQLHFAPGGQRLNATRTKALVRQPKELSGSTVAIDHAAALWIQNQLGSVVGCKNRLVKPLALREQLLGPLALAHIEMGAARAQRQTVSVTLGHATAVLNPDPTAVFMTQTVFEAERRGAPHQVGMQNLLITEHVRWMDPFFPLAHRRIGGKFPFAANHLPKTRIEANVAAFQVPIPRR